MMGTQALASGSIHLQSYRLLRGKLAFFYFDMMDKQAGCFGGIGDTPLPVCP